MIVVYGVVFQALAFSLTFCPWWWSQRVGTGTPGEVALIFWDEWLSCSKAFGTGFPIMGFRVVLGGDFPH